jgi:hypothetical protein
MNAPHDISSHDARQGRMTRSAIFVLLAGVAGLAACDTSYSAMMAKLSPDQLRMAKTDDLCEAYGGGQGGKAIADELVRRGATTPDELGAVRAGRVQTGMSRCAVLALLGDPVVVTQTAVSQTLAFRGERFITFQNGKVVEISR